MEPRRAFLLVETHEGKKKSVAEAMAKIPGVVTAEQTMGAYDIIAVIECKDFNALSSITAEIIAKINGIRRHVTCVAVKIE